MINKIIRNFLAKQAAGRSDDGIMITLRDPQKIEMLENIMADLLMRNGIDPRAITSEAQLKTIINQIEAASKQTTQSGIRNVESAKVFDLEGKEIPKGSKIMGGKAVDDDLPPPGSRGGDEDIAAPVQSSEETLKNMIVAENKKNIAAMKQRKMLDDAIEDASPGFSGDRKYDAEIVAENLAERMGLVYDDLPTKQRLDLYDQAYTGLSKKRPVQRESLEDFVDDAGGVDPDDPRGIDDFIPDPEDKATGGRVGLKVGTGFKFLQKVFGKEKFKEMATRDPEMYQGLLEVVDMYRKRDKEGLKMYLQKFLPHMDDAQIEDFIRGSDGTEGLIGELIRLGSGRDYQGKIEMIKKAERMRKLDDLEITDDMIRKPNADGGRIGYKLGTGIEAAIAENKRLQSGIDAELEMQRQIEKFLEDRMIRSSPFGILMDREPPNISDDQFKPPSTLDKSGKDAKIKKLPFKPDQSKDIIIFDDGTVYYKDTGEFYDEDLGQVTSPSPGAKPVRETKGARDGGIMRLGFKDGMNRRTFMKLFTGLVSLPIIGKVLKPLKVGKKVTQVPIIKTDNVAGKPEWFDQLVNKVILEGDDMTKQFATKEREIVHATKIGKDDYVRVTQDLDEGSVRVEYESLDNMYEDPVQLRYKKPNPDEGDPRPSAEFDVAESGPVGRADGPDDYSIDIDEVGGTSISDLTSDVSKLKQYATGQKPTIKEMMQIKRRKDKARRITEGGEAEMDAVIERQGEFIENDLVDLDPPDFASGGIARMLGE